MGHFRFSISVFRQIAGRGRHIPESCVQLMCRPANRLRRKLAACEESSPDQPQPDRERLAEQLAAVSGIHFDHTLDHFRPMGWDLERFEHVQYALADGLVYVQGPLPGLSRQVRQAEGPAVLLAVVARLKAEELVEPPLDDLRVQNEVEWTMEEHPPAEASERPEGVSWDRRLDHLPQERRAERLLGLQIEPFETRTGTPHLGKLVRSRFDRGLAPLREEHRAQPRHERVLNRRA